MNWNPGPTGGLSVQTSFCRLDVWENEGAYTGIVRGYFKDILIRRDDLPSEEAAQAWCEQEYKALLLAEVATLGE